jgi:DNA primase
MEEYEIDDLKSNLREYLESHSINTNKMFRCINPYHTDSNASMKYFDDNKVYCFGCGQTYNLFDVISLIENVSKKEAFKRAINYYYKNQQKPMESLKMKPKENKEKTLKDYQKAYFVWHKNFKKNEQAKDYLESRGIDTKLVDKYNIGFNEFHFKDGDMKALIIPITANCFTARNIDITNKEFRYYKPTGCHTDILNKTALTNSISYCVIAEGEFDCLSYETVGVNAISLGGVNNVPKFKELDKDNKKTYILSLDNDEAGNQAKNELIDYFKENKIKYAMFDNIGYKDANQALTENKTLFENEITKFTQRIIKNNLKNQDEM